MIQLAIICLSTLFFMALERLRPGRALPNVPGWYTRAVFLNLCQLSLVYIASLTWNRWIQAESLTHLPSSFPAPLQGFLIWLAGTFVFYIWHRIRHRSGWWQIFHQVHHSPSRIETLTSFYKHPLEMTVNSMIISLIVYGVFGGTIEVAGWYNVFAVLAEFFYHANISTPDWIGYFIQRPEHHSIHHARNIHRYNFGDITLWDRLFGTFKDTHEFVPTCGFDNQGEIKLNEMLVFKDIHK